MKLKQILLLTAIGTTVVACSESDHERMSGSDGIITIQSAGNKFATRFNDVANAWEPNDAIGVYMLNSTDEYTLNEADNVKYQTAAGGATASFTAATVGIQIPGETANFYGYHPYTESVSGYTYPVGLVDQSAGYSDYDLMWAKTPGLSSTEITNSGLTMKFSHQLCKAKINVTLGTGMTTLESVIIQGMNTAADFDIVSGTLSNERATEDIIPFSSSSLISEAILLPTTTPGNLVLTFYADGDKYQWAMPSSSTITEFKAGHLYVFNIGLGASPVGTIDEIKTDTSTPWNDEGGENGEAGKVQAPSAIPAGYTKVVVDASTVTDVAGLNALLGANSGKVALAFTADTYSFADGKIQIPDAITHLMMVCDSEIGQAKLKVKEIGLNSYLEDLHFYNLEVEGELGASFCYQSSHIAANAVITIEKCYFHTMDYVFCMRQSSTLASFNVLNSRISSVNTLLETTSNCPVTEVNLTNSTLYNFSGRVVNLNSSTVVPTINVNYCTMVAVTGTPFECNNGDSGNLYYKNNISNVTNSYNNFTYKVTVQESSDNYRVVGSLSPSSGCTEYAEADLFTDSSTGKFYLKVALDAGDPYWR